MYNKNLTEDLRLRLSTDDMDFLRHLSEQRAVSVSECIRSILGEYRRSLMAMETLQKALETMGKEGKLFNGNTETNLDNIV